MPSLKFSEKRLLEDIFDMSDGYVSVSSERALTNPQFADFFREYYIDIYADKYAINGNSKANRLRAFWGLETDHMVGRALEGLLDCLDQEVVDKGKFTSALKIVNRLLNREEVKSVEEETEDDFLHKEFGKIDLSKLNLSGPIFATLEQRLEEIHKCLQAKAALSVIFLCGSTLEGVLLYIASSKPKEFNTAKATPKDSDTGKPTQFHKWSLNSLINVAAEKGYLGLDVKKFSHELRDFRNYIHPFEQTASGFTPDMHTAKICWQVLQAAIAQLSVRSK